MKVQVPTGVTRAQIRCLRNRFNEPTYNRFHPQSRKNAVLAPLDRPLRTALADRDPVQRSDTIMAIFQHVLHTRRSYATWKSKDWFDCFNRFKSARTASFRHAFILAAYRISGLIIVDQLFDANQLLVSTRLAEAMFGSSVVKRNIKLICDTLVSLGYVRSGVVPTLPPAVAEIMLTLGEPNVMRWKELVSRVEASPRYARFTDRLHAVSVALVALGVIKDPTRFRAAFGFAPHKKFNHDSGIAKEWRLWADRFYEISTLDPRTKRRISFAVRRVGRWLHKTRPSITSPRQWDTKLAAEFVAAICEWKIGDYLDEMPENIKRNLGQQIKPGTKRGYLSSLRTFFVTLQDAELIPTRFNPITALRAPKSITSQIDHAPRVLADDVWAKLVYVGVNLKQEDIPKSVGYPLELIRAVAINWLFDGMRNDELMRLEVGCVEREPTVIDLTTGEARPGVCQLRVPANKYKGSFPKPVDDIVADAIEAWERVRPKQPPMLDRKTRRLTHRLFAFRGKPVGQTIVNERIIPLLCKLAGVPRTDAIGRITSHRARSTIASQLYNAERPLSLLELKEWLGHEKVDSVLAYVKTDRKKLMRAYASADYFKRNVARVTVLLDREAIESGRAANGEPYKYYDLGHGYCKYNFFSQCPHRMACVRCSFYLPKGSDAARLLEAKANNERLIEEVPLRDDEVEAARGDAAKIAELAQTLGLLPAPDGTHGTDGVTRQTVPERITTSPQG